MNLIIEPDFVSRVPDYRALLIEANVVNTPTSQEQIEEMNRLADDIASQYQVTDINSIPAIAATRLAYKACGKDPNRYRPSQEQMMRRIVRGLGLYYVNALVDAGNQLSLITGCSVGCFDADKIDGDTLTLGIGREGEPYEGIGRGVLNIAGLPVFRDITGGVGTPTSDNERTKIDLTTTRLVMTIHLFDPDIDPSQVIATATDIFSRYCHATSLRATLYQPHSSPAAT